MFRRRIHHFLRSARRQCYREPAKAPAIAVLIFGSTAGVLLHSASAKSRDDDCTKSYPVESAYRNTLLRRRFLSYASLSYNGEPLMTGSDFINAIVDTYYVKEDPEPMRELGTVEYEHILERASWTNLNDINFLKNAGADYIISYPEFLFLLSILVKPIDQFSKHFKILDLSRSNSLSKEEFLSIESLTTNRSRDMESSKSLITSMQMLFFGHNQKKEVDFEMFSKFLHGVQKQCLYAEFEKYSDGLDFITDDEFMRLLLRRTYISNIKKARYIDRLESRPEERRMKLSFSQFCQFMNLLNDFPDFEVAIRMFAITKKPLTKADFQRAVLASTGEAFDNELIDVVFEVFDEDNDNKLGQDEFIKVMKDSIKSRTTSSYHLHSSTTDSPWGAYMGCVRDYMYRSYAS